MGAHTHTHVLNAANPEVDIYFQRHLSGVARAKWAWLGRGDDKFGFGLILNLLLVGDYYINNKAKKPRNKIYLAVQTFGQVQTWEATSRLTTLI